MTEPENTDEDQVEETTTEDGDEESVPFEMPQVIVAGIDPETETFPGL